MDIGIEFLLRLLDHQPCALVDWDDLHGRFSTLLCACQAAGFLNAKPSVHPAPTCPECFEGVPLALEGTHLCDHCLTEVDPRYLQCWGFDLRAFLGWLAVQLHLRGEVRTIEAGLWQLGSREDEGGVCECFYSSGGPVSPPGLDRLHAYQSVVLLYGLHRPPGVEALPVTAVSLLSVLGLGESLSATHWSSRGRIRFDAHTGRLDVGGEWKGEVPPGSREHAFLDCLLRRQGQVVGYDQIKREVLHATGGRDSRDAASFCHRIKSRIKKEYLPAIDTLIATSNRGDGYRLRQRREP